MQSEKRIDLHDSKIISKQNESRHEDYVLWSIPKMRKQLESSRRCQPYEVAENYVPRRFFKILRKRYSMQPNCDPPPRKMVTAILYRFCTLIDNHGD